MESKKIITNYYEMPDLDLELCDIGDWEEKNKKD